ncbi:hypothetical protein L479_02051 [Exiguobacterium sp. S17]|nr:hypothetical protein L479_02051 [Exiguobacterium sp. S17]
MTHPNFEHSYDPTATDLGIAFGRNAMSLDEMASGNVYEIA